MQLVWFIHSACTRDDAWIEDADQSELGPMLLCPTLHPPTKTTDGGVGTKRRNFVVWKKLMRGGGKSASAEPKETTLDDLVPKNRSASVAWLYFGLWTPNMHTSIAHPQRISSHSVAHPREGYMKATKEGEQI